MNQKAAKKFRKDVRKIVDSKLVDGMQTLSKITRQRPKWIPKFIWIIAYYPLFPKKYRKFIYKYIQ